MSKDKSDSLKLSSELHRTIYACVQATAVDILSTEEISLDPLYRLENRTHDSTTDDKEAVENLAEQLSSLDLINPLLILCRAKQTPKYILISGLKRLAAARAAGKKEVQCKIINEKTLIAKLPKQISKKEHQLYLSEVFKNISYSESAHHTQLTDRSLYSYLLQIRENHNLEKSGFDRIRKLLGLKYQKSAYRNTLRIWSVACCRSARELLDKKIIKLSIVKKDSNIRALENPDKAKHIVTQLTHYAESLRRNAKDDEQDKDIIALKGYRDSDVEKIIRDVDLFGTSSIGKKKTRYRTPQFSYSVENSQMKLPQATLDLQDFSSNNIRKLLESYYKMNLAVEELTKFFAAIKPSQPGGVVKTLHNHTPQRVDYGKNYFQFIMNNNMQLYSHIQKIDSYLKTIHPLASKEELQKHKRTAKRYELLLQKFHEFSIEDANKQLIKILRDTYSNDQEVIELSATYKEAA